MAKKKKKSPKRTTQKKSTRIARAKSWLPTYTGSKIVRAYRKKFHVDIPCAVRELQEIGYEFKPEYVENLLKSEAIRVEQLRIKREEKRISETYNDFQDDNFYFIAGYTPGGAPYGVTWTEMGLEPYENEYDSDDFIGEYKYYDFLSKKEQDCVNDKLRESFTKYVKTNRRIPSKVKTQELIEKVSGKYYDGRLQYPKDFGKTYRKIVHKRENKFIREGVLPKKFSPTELHSFFEQSVMLESERLIFRKITQDDFDDLAEMLRNPEVMYAWEHTFSDEQIQAWIDRQIARYKEHIVGYFAAIDRESGEFIGQMGLMWNDFGELRALEIGYMLKRRYWGKGYATEGAEALAQYAFATIGVNKVYASIRPNNESSIRVAERIGMVAESSFVKQYEGKDMEHIIYAKYRKNAEK